MLPETNLILGNWENSKKLSVTKNNKQELELKNNDKTLEYYQGISYCDFILNPSTNYVIQVKLE